MCRLFLLISWGLILRWHFYLRGTLFEDFLLSNVLTLLSQMGLTDWGTDETMRQQVTYPLSITPYKRARSTVALPAIFSLQFWFLCPLWDGKPRWAPPCSRHAPSLPIEGHCLPKQHFHTVPAPAMLQLIVAEPLGSTLSHFLIFCPYYYNKTNKQKRK